MFVRISLIMILSLPPLSQSKAEDSISQAHKDSVEYYQYQKLKQEVKNAIRESYVNPVLRELPTYAGLATALVAVITAFFSIIKFFNEKRIELKVSKDNQFKSFTSDLGSDNFSLRANAAVSLFTFLEPVNKAFYRQTYYILLANLKMEQEENINSLLVKAFEKAIRLLLHDYEPEKVKKDTVRAPFELDLSHTNLYRIDLHGLNLENVDLAFCKLHYANLEGCNLRRAKGIEAEFLGARLSHANLQESRLQYALFEKAYLNNANLISAKLQYANFDGASFRQAKMQEANLNYARIYGAKFENAILTNAFFKHTELGDNELKSILKARNSTWQKANFLKPQSKKIKRMANG